jgi:hypothetical protein
MRVKAIGPLVALVLVSPIFVTYAGAQRHGIGAGAPIPHISAPAPHFSSPAPHISTPRFVAPHAAPHFAAPHLLAPRLGAPRFGTPRVAAPAPHFAPHVSTPRFAAPQRRFAGPRISTPSHKPSTFVGPARAPGALARHLGGPALSNVPRARGRLSQPTSGPSSAQHGRLPGNILNGPARGTANVAHDRRVRPGAAETVGQGTGGADRNLAETARTQTHNADRTPILRNPTFASLSSRNPATRLLAQSTFRGSFARSGFAKEGRSRGHRRFGIVLGFVGPLFWPYAYEDFIDYTFWPYAYDTFWPYAFDDVFEGIYGAYAPEYYAAEGVYTYAGSPVSGAAYSHANRMSRSGRTAALMGGSSQICSGQAHGLTDFPIERIAQQTEPDQLQQPLLDGLKVATAKAVSILQAACPSELPSTPTGRIAAMRTRVEAMLQAVRVVRPALEKFYQSLGDEQKERFISIETTGRQQPDLTGLCSGRTPRGAGLPVSQIERTLRLSDDQDAALNDLNDASAKAALILKTNCQPDQSLTPTGRLATMEDRLSAIRQALDIVQPTLARFYDSLNDEQKARFDRLDARPVWASGSH